MVVYCWSWCVLDVAADLLKTATSNVHWPPLLLPACRYNYKLTCGREMTKVMEECLASRSPWKEAKNIGANPISCALPWAMLSRPMAPWASRCVSPRRHSWGIRRRGMGLRPVRVSPRWRRATDLGFSVIGHFSVLRWICSPYGSNPFSCEKCISGS